MHRLFSKYCPPVQYQQLQRHLTPSSDYFFNQMGGSSEIYTRVYRRMDDIHRIIQLSMDHGSTNLLLKQTVVFIFKL